MTTTPSNYLLHAVVSPFPVSVIEKLLSHSDCDGSIESADCGPIADRLEELLPFFGEHSDERSEMAFFRGKTERFIIGLRKAAAAGEDVEFH